MSTLEDWGSELSELLDEIEALLAQALPGDPFCEVMSAGLEEQRATIESGGVTEALVIHCRGARDRLRQYVDVDDGLSLLAEALQRKE